MTMQPMKQHYRSFTKLTSVPFKHRQGRCDIYHMETDISLFCIARPTAYSCTWTD